MKKILISFIGVLCTYTSLAVVAQKQDKIPANAGEVFTPYAG